MTKPKIGNKFPMPFLFSKSLLPFSTKNEKRIFALGLIAMNQERLRLYDSLSSSNDVMIDNLSEIEKRQHFKNFMPPIKLVEREASFSIEYLKAFTGLTDDSLRKGLGRASKSITGRTVVFDESDKKKYLVGSFAPIYEASFDSTSGLKIFVAESAVPIMMDHSSGFNEIDIKLFVELDGIHSLRLLDIISGHKENTMFKWKLDTFRFRFGVDFRRFESQEQIDELAKTGEYITSGCDVGDKILDIEGNDFPIYPHLKNLRARVLTPAFAEIIKKSNGAWIATDKAGLGYELIKTGRRFTHIQFCLKYNPDAESVLPRIEDQEQQETPNSASEIEEAVITKSDLVSNQPSKTDELTEDERAAIGRILLERLKSKGSIELIAELLGDDYAKKRDEKIKKRAEEKAALKERCDKFWSEFSVDKFNYQYLELYFMTNGGELTYTSDPITLAIESAGNIEVTRLVDEQGGWYFEYQFCGQDIVVKNY